MPLTLLKLLFEKFTYEDDVMFDTCKVSTFVNDLPDTSISVPVLVRVFVVTEGAMRDWVLTSVILLKLLVSTSITVPELVRVSVVTDGAIKD